MLSGGTILHGSVSEDQWQDFLDLLFELAEKKSWLREECFWTLYRFVQTTAPSDRADAFLQATVEKLRSDKMALTPEGVAVWLAVQKNHAGVPLPQKPWHRRDPLRRRNAEKLAAAMKGSPAASEGEKGTDDEDRRQRGSWSALPHFAWRVIMDHLYQVSEDRRRLDFATFWHTCVDEHLFSASASAERKHSGFSLFCQVVLDGPPHVLDVLFTENFLKCLINHAAEKERYLHRMATKCLKAMLARVEQDPGSAAVISKGLLEGNGTPLFDHLTRTKTVTTIVTGASPAVLPEIASLLLHKIRRQDAADAETAESHRRALGEILAAALGGVKGAAAEASTYDILFNLCELAYVDERTAPVPPLSAGSRDFFRTKLSSIFARQISSTTPTERLDWPRRLISDLQRLETSDARSMLMDFDDVVDKGRRAAWKRVRRLKEAQATVEDERKRPLQMVVLLYSIAMFELYNGNRDALSGLADLDLLCDKLLGREDAEVGFSELLVESLLALVSKPSQLLRRLAQQVFGAFTAELSLRSLQLLYDVGWDMLGLRPRG